MNTVLLKGLNESLQILVHKLEFLKNATLSHNKYLKHSMGCSAVIFNESYIYLYKKYIRN